MVTMNKNLIFYFDIRLEIFQIEVERILLVTQIISTSNERVHLITIKITVIHLRRCTNIRSLSIPIICKTLCFMSIYPIFYLTFFTTIRYIMTFSTSFYICIFFTNVNIQLAIICLHYYTIHTR